MARLYNEQFHLSQILMASSAHNGHQRARRAVLGPRARQGTRASEITCTAFDSPCRLRLSSPQDARVTFHSPRQA